MQERLKADAGRNPPLCGSRQGYWAAWREALALALALASTLLADKAAHQPFVEEEPETFKRNDDHRRRASAWAETEQARDHPRALTHQRRSVGDCGVL
jgi:hypothetical protein